MKQILITFKPDIPQQVRIKISDEAWNDLVATNRLTPEEIVYEMVMARVVKKWEVKENEVNESA
jgi:LPS sulfotransferase NodH